MRIIGGAFKGRRLTPVGAGDSAAHLRPTTDRTRESLFNILAGGRFGDPIPDATVLDLFAGTGALGLEAVSRGAARAVFVENGRKSLSILRRNIALLDVEKQSRVLQRDALKLPENTGPAANLVFLDPPYGKGYPTRVLEGARAAGWIDSGALIVVEDESPVTPSPSFDLLETRRMGVAVFSFIEPRDWTS